MKPYPNVMTDCPAPHEHDPEDFINPVGFGRAIGGFLLIVLTVASCAALGIYLATKQ